VILRVVIRLFNVPLGFFRSKLHGTETLFILVSVCIFLH
jgi:hypothetical protein